MTFEEGQIEESLEKKREQEEPRMKNLEQLGDKALDIWARQSEL